ncbi:PD-(D/E)XK nuclease family transposase [Bacillus benzoevorans]|uniref:Putative transposase/invertase (TIGR01784 family) n=1 Tax=Bacillus benzoevorans TaxID=1456 RepID=A0A7X0HR47_9BACI|nr:PD-(D/E)XK nuclease family transposase [Bacillus benzoevorans]MBB6444095.1 putative transposase/invertase (TIGR01784 family) [Bacillus benzoevorans]
MTKLIRGCVSDRNILVSTSRNERTKVEIQLINQYDMLPERTLYYWSKLFSASLGAGQDYSELAPTTTNMIPIMNYPPHIPFANEMMHKLEKLGLLYHTEP